MTCLQHMELDLDLGEGDKVALCARYAGMGDEVIRTCEWCCFNEDN
jgi:hypothetical protein